MPGKRQHYVPRFVLRRFAIDPAAKTPHVWRLDKRTGRPNRVNPANEVVVGHYYRMVLEDGTVVDEADELLTRIEDMAAGVIRKLVDPGYTVTGDDVFQLLLFIVSLKNRTPQAREALREADERAAELDAEVRLSDREAYHRIMRKEGESEEETEAGRLKALKDLKSGRVVIESTPEREVALMFVGFQEAVGTLLGSLGVVCMRVPESSKRRFVVSDHPVSHYDPTPKTPEAGVSFLSSPNSVTWVPLDPKFGLLLVQTNPGTWENSEVSDAEIDELNAQTYAWAREAIYGDSQEAVTHVRRVAKQNPALMREVRYRPPRVWVARGADRAGVHEFTSRFRGDTVKRKLHVTQLGADEARRGAWPPDD